MMFKLESYVTPLLLSYVDKFIKNLKPEDSQLSLWGGDASFCNLDLRLDVLEKELDLPFTFVNGHIHELRIHVPWTKLGSESVVITINTIECILKLHTENDVEEGASHIQTFSATSLVKKLPRKQDTPEAPPGYVQSLINRVLGNICIVCNNLILKYVEDDIVLSLNIKSAELFNVNERWERSFIDTYPALTVRKIISMQDLTVCLDKRDGSGKIETYQDPLLYRCSTVWRLYTVYSIAHSKSPIITRINMYCDQLDFSLTDQQLPMFLRLMKLCYALHCKNYCLTPKKHCYTEDSDCRSQSCDEEIDSTDVEEEGWGSWAWSYIPQVFPGWADEADVHTLDSDNIQSKKILQFGIFIDKASCVFKTTETSSDSCYGSPKFSFTPFAVLHQYGCSIELTLKGKEFLNVQFGMTCATICGLNKCICGCKNFSNCPGMEKPFLRAGVPLGSTDTYNFLSSTLFDPLAPENCGQKRNYCFDQQLHLSQLTEEVLVKRFPAVAFDYVYELQIPDEWIDKASLVTTTFLEESNWKENSVCRFVVGPSCTDIDSSMIHFFTKLVNSSKDYDYPLYFPLESGKTPTSLIIKDAEEMECLEEFVPFRSYHLTCFKPILRLFPADHLHCDTPMKNEKGKMRKKKKRDAFKEQALPPTLLLKISTECIDLHLHYPMYPIKMAMIVSKLAKPSQNLLYHCSSNLSFKLLGAEVILLKCQSIDHQPEKTLIPSFNAKLSRKSICNSDYWINQKDFPLEEYNFECSHIQLLLTEPVFFTLLCMYQSWTKKDFIFEHLSNFISVFSNIKGNDDILHCNVKGIEAFISLTESVVSCKGSISSICIKLCNQDHSTFLLRGPENTFDVCKGSLFIQHQKENIFINTDSSASLALFQLLFQFPRKVSCDAWLLMFHMRGVAICLEPAIMNWFSHDLHKYFEANFRDSSNLISPTSFEDSSTCSSATPIASGSFSVSQCQSVGVENSIDYDFYNDIQRHLAQNYPILKNIKMQLKVESVVVLVPDSCWCVESKKSIAALDCWAEAFNMKKLISACIICFPDITIKSNISHLCFEQTDNIKEIKLPTNLTKVENKDPDFFPWIIEIKKLCIYTVNDQQKDENIFFIWSPSSATATVAVTSKSNQNQLAVCIHVDTTALNINYSAFQVQLIVNSLNVIASFTSFSNVLNTWLMMFLHKFEESSYATAKSSCDVIKDAVFKEINFSGHEEKSNPVFEYCGDTSKTASTIEKKVTFWVQLTLSKCSISFFGRFESSNPMYFQCQFVSEEVITSLDIQDVYSKGKIKISSLNINYYLRNSINSDWCLGLHDGVVMCCSHKLRRNVMNSNYSDNIVDHASTLTESQPFLLITYTRALSVHAKQKWIAFADEDCIIKNAAKYISELDINIKSFDLILWIFLFKAMYDACFHLSNATFFEYLTKPKKHQYSNSITGINFSNQALPLLYVNTSSIRIFFPKCFFPYLNMYEEKTELSPTKSKSNFTIIPDTLLLYVNHICLTSQVENPLARIILNAELYEAALNSKTLLLPGSDIEDRQYQLDIYGLSVGSVISTHIAIHHSVCELPRGYMQIMGENPALEWNIGVVNESRKQGNGEPLLITPLLSTMDIKLAVAPAIVSKNSSSKEISQDVVSGITVEMSIANEIFIYFSARQLELLKFIIDNSQSIFFPTKYKSIHHEKHSQISACRPPSRDFLPDSGIESETSTFIHFELPDIPIKSNDTYEFIPFEILVTAGSISVILFLHEEDLVNEHCMVHKEFEDGSTLFSEHTVALIPTNPMAKTLNRNCTNMVVQSNMRKQTNENIHAIQSCVNPRKMHTIYPIILVSVTQPHSFLKVYTSNQRFEVSCFDINIKGSFSNYVITSDSSATVPSVSDFRLHYLETKPGEANEKTGIPPSFWTITCTDFLHLPSKMQMRLERPVKCNVDNDLFNQIERILKSFKQKIINFHIVPSKCDNEFFEIGENNKPAEDSNIKFDLLSLFEKVEVCTTQIVVESNFKETEKPVTLIASLDILKGEFVFRSTKHCTKSFKLHLNLTGLAWKVLVSGEICPFLFPASMTLILKCQLEPYFHLKVSVEGETIFINFRLKHFFAQLEAINYLIKKLHSKMFYTISNSCQDTQILSTYTDAKFSTKKLFWHDDLRKGSFYFNQTFSQTSSKPDIYEIVFSKAEQNQPASMTWRYPQPRILTKIEISPVPFQCAIDQQLGGNTLQKVTCYIQFWDSLHHKFINKCNFQLSEAVHKHLEFPLDSNSSMEFSDVWRVTLDYGDVTFDSIKDEQSLLSPFALAACLCIDSCFDPSIIPSIQFIFSLSLMKINLYNFSRTERQYNMFLPFTFDDGAPINQEFLSFSVEKPSFYCGKWPTGFRIEGCFEMGCDVLEYRNLTMVPFVNPFDVRIDGHAYYERSKYPIFELEVTCQPCFIRMTQSIIHTLKYAIHCSSLEMNQMANSPDFELNLPNYYIICNNTQESFRFGQVDTEENIFLPSQKLHAYSWRSHKCDQKLQISFECTKWTWSEPFFIEACGLQNVFLGNDTIAHIKVKSLSNLQKQVIIEGELIIYNCLNLELYLKLSIINPILLEKSIAKIITHNLKQFAAVTFIVSRSERISICLSLIEDCDMFSSKWINIYENTQELINIHGDKMPMRNVLLHISNKIIKTFHFTLVAINPSFIIRNYLPNAIIKSKNLSDVTENIGLTIQGKGREAHFLEDVNTSKDIEITLQKSHFVKISIPAFEILLSERDYCLNTNDELKVEDFLLSDLESTTMLKHKQINWPFDSIKCDNLSKNRIKLYNDHVFLDSVPIVPEVYNPKIIIETKYEGNRNSISINVKPWALFFNMTEVEFFLVDSNKEEHCLPPNSVMIPPFITECFCLAVMFENVKFFSSPLCLLEEKASKHFAIEGEIPQNGTISMAIRIESNQVKVCIFCIKSEMHNNIRILTILPLMHLKNNTSYDFILSLYATQLQSSSIFNNLLSLETGCPNNSSMQFMFWGSDKKANFDLSLHENSQLAFYITFSVYNLQELQLSRPLCFSSNLPTDMRHTFSFSSTFSNSSSMPFVLTSHQKDGFWYLVLSCDPAPLILLHNRTSILLYYGQNVNKSENVIVCEELRTKLPLPSLSPGRSSYYTFPDLQKQFPKLVDPFPKFRLGCEDQSTQSCVWSPPIDIDVDNQFICIPEICYIKISRERVGHTINLYINLVNRIEFTANEIRSRIGMTNDRTLHCSGPNVQSEYTLVKKFEGTQKTAVKQKKSANHFEIDRVAENSAKFFFSLCMTLRANHISFAVCDELKSPRLCSEVMRFNMQDILLYLRSNEKICPFNYSYELCFCIGDIQIDNQIDQEDNIVYDFPVIFKPHCIVKPVFEDFASTLPNKARENAFMKLEATIEIQPIGRTLIFQIVKISFKPINLYLEDAFYFKALNLCKIYLPVTSPDHAYSNNFMNFPNDIVSLSTMFVYPVRIKYLQIDIPEIYLNIHASLKLYLSIENSVLKFQPFTKTEIFTNFYELGRIVVIHYLTGALFRAGWVVGSLDLLGNPANFARAIGSGIADFVLLPYHGLLNGPKAFISGLASGAISLVSGISSGAITCVTNLASSISRNMDLLSLDAEHLAHQEMLRHHLPDGVTSGLLQGLSGLGISLLGAIAGVVDHPLQVLVTPTNPINTAKGVVTGLGKGILGILTKPVGGAAVFVSQAGRGILHEAGWSVQCKRQYQSYSAQTEGFLNSLLKYKWKIFQTSAFGEVLLSVEATHLDENGYYEENILILTSEVLCVFDPEDDVQRQTFSLSEIKCHMSEKDPSALVISHCQLQKTNLFQEITDVSDRVADYVQKSCLNKSDAMQFSFDEETHILNFEFYVQPNLRELFLALFSLAKRTLHKKGFPFF